MSRSDEQFLAIVFWLAVLILIFSRRRAGPSKTAFGQAAWMTTARMRAAGLIARAGTALIVGRTDRGQIIRLPSYCHTLLVGGTGSGKGVSVVIPNLLAHRRGSVVVFDTKGDRFDITAARREKNGERILRLGPFTGGSNKLNPLDAIPPNSPLLIDLARACAESLVIRKGTETDEHWIDKSCQIICNVLVLVLRNFASEKRNLNTVAEIISAPLLDAAADKLIEIGGIFERLGHQIKALFDPELTGVLSKEGASVHSTVSRFLSFLDSEFVAAAVASSTFEVKDLLKPNHRVTLYIQIPPDMLEAQRGLLRCWISNLIRVIGSSGNESSSEVLFLLDEASALGSLGALQEAAVRGRSAGVRLLLAYQLTARCGLRSRTSPRCCTTTAPPTSIWVPAAMSRPS